MPSIEQWGDRAERAPFLTMTKIIAIFLILGGIGWGIKVVMTPARSAAEIVEKTLDADNVIQNYEWFKNQKGSYDAALVKLDSANRALATFNASAGDRKGWTFEDKQEHARLTTIVSGLEGHVASTASDYNARSRMMNRSIFKEGFIVLKDKDSLPETLSLTPPTPVEKR
jgi:hypothetical protein